VRACHDLSEGGLGVAAAEMAFAGGLGMRLELPTAAGLDDFALLWSESPTRWLVEVAPEEAAEFAALLEGVPCVEVGALTAAPDFVVVGTKGDDLIRADVAALKQAWQRSTR
jgi:phosphoribosylformylglycinamidine synthase